MLSLLHKESCSFKLSFVHLDQLLAPCCKHLFNPDASSLITFQISCCSLSPISCLHLLWLSACVLYLSQIPTLGPAPLTVSTHFVINKLPVRPPSAITNDPSGNRILAMNIASNGTLVSNFSQGFWWHFNPVSLEWDHRNQHWRTRRWL